MKHFLNENRLSYHSEQINTLLKITKLIHNHDQPIKAILREVVFQIPPAIGSSKNIGVRILIDKNEFKTSNFYPTDQVISYPITVFDRVRGKLEVNKLEENNTLNEDFQREEKHFLEIIANELGIIFEQRKIEDELIQSKNELQSLFDHMDDFLLILDVGGNVLHANQTVVERLGYSEKELLKKNINEIIINYHETNLDDITKLPSINISLLTESGERIPVETRITQIKWRGSKKLIAISRDISALIVAEKKQSQSVTVLRKTLGGAIQAIAEGVEVRDSYTAGHQRRVANLARAIATKMNLSLDKIEGIRTAGSIHDIGKIAVPSEILSKTSKLLEVEFELIKRHTNVGFQILKTIDFPWPVAAIVYQHHEKIDGSGYPLGLDGDMILIEAKILCVADVVEAMATHRPYRPALGMEAALEEIVKNRGKFYDPDVVDACLTLFESGELLIYDDMGHKRPF